MIQKGGCRVPFLFVADMDEFDEANFKPDYEEVGGDVDIIASENSVPSATLKRSRKQVKSCMCCDRKGTHVKRHVLGSDLPYYVMPDECCWLCKEYQRQPNTLANHQANEHEGIDSAEIYFSDKNLVNWAHLMFALLFAMHVFFRCTGQ